MRFALALAMMACSLFSLPARAETQGLGNCFVDSLTGKERKELARWIFFAIAAHPDMSSHSNVSAEDRASEDKLVGTLITRLLVKDCAADFQAAQKADASALGGAFELVGQVAMQELMRDPAVEKAINGYAEHLDKEKIGAVLSAP